MAVLEIARPPVGAPSITAWSTATEIDDHNPQKEHPESASSQETATGSAIGSSQATAGLMRDEEACNGPIDLHLALEVDPRAPLGFEDKVIDPVVLAEETMGQAGHVANKATAMTSDKVSGGGRSAGRRPAGSL